MCTGSCQRKTVSGSHARGNHYIVDAMAFSPSIEIDVLMISYSDGELVVFDKTTNDFRYSSRNIFAQNLACSPDGSLLAACWRLGPRVAQSTYSNSGPSGTELLLISRAYAAVRTFQGVERGKPIPLLDGSDQKLCLLHPTEAENFVLLDGENADVYSWSTATKLEALLHNNLGALTLTITPPTPIISSSLSGFAHSPSKPTPFVQTKPVKYFAHLISPPNFDSVSSKSGLQIPSLQARQPPLQNQSRIQSIWAPRCGKSSPYGNHSSYSYIRTSGFAV